MPTQNKTNRILDLGQEISGNLLTEVFNKILGQGYPIAAAVVNGTNYHMRLIPGIHTHHGQYTESPAPTLGPLPSTEEDEKTIHHNIMAVGMKSVGASASEAIFGYEFEKDGKTYQLCFYLKHGHHLESGSALWEKNQKVNNENYSDKIHKAAESLIHTIQKNKSQTSYSKDGEGTSVTVDGIKVSHSSGETLQFIIEQV